MPNGPVPAAAEGLPDFDPNHFDLALHHMAMMMDMMVSELCEIDRGEEQPASSVLERLDTLAWIARDQMRGMAEQFLATAFERAVAQEVRS